MRLAQPGSCQRAAGCRSAAPAIAAALGVARSRRVAAAAGQGGAAAGAAAAPQGATAAPPPMEIMRLPPEVLAAGGLDPSRDSRANVAAFGDMLATAFLPINLAALPGLRVQNVDPPVLTCDEFLPPAVCDALVAAAQASGRLKASQVGGTVALTKEDIRTSHTLAITKDVLAACPDLAAPLQQLLVAAQQLVGPGLDTSALADARFERPTLQTQLCPELPQIAHYQPGQHFLAHEDGFPGRVALDKGYNRRATLLVYLNDVPQGGATCFEHLGLRVQPQRGKALLFFPAFSGGKSDARTLHTAEDAVEGCEKWVFQLWLCSGLPPRPPVDAAANQARLLAEARKGGSSASAARKTKQRSGGKGGGSKRR